MIVLKTHEDIAFQVPGFQYPIANTRRELSSEYKRSVRETTKQDPATS